MTREELIKQNRAKVRDHKIAVYEDSIKALEQMKKIYEEDVHLYGGYYNAMMDEINSQIEDCKGFIENIKMRYAEEEN